jgi:hypothetical protein
MNTVLKASLTLIAIASGSLAEEGHIHDKIVPGPKGGRLLEVTSGGHAEFYVEKDKKISVTFYDPEMKPVAPGERMVKVIAEAPAGKTTLDFEKAGDALVSSSVLPEGDGYRIVVQIRPTADAKPQNFRIDYHDETCGECKLAEYACVCSDHKSHEH